MPPCDINAMSASHSSWIPGLSSPVTACQCYLFAKCYLNTPHRYNTMQRDERRTYEQIYAYISCDGDWKCTQDNTTQLQHCRPKLPLATSCCSYEMTPKLQQEYPNDEKVTNDSSTRIQTVLHLHLSAHCWLRNPGWGLVVEDSRQRTSG